LHYNSVIYAGCEARITHLPNYTSQGTNMVVRQLSVQFTYTVEDESVFKKDILGPLTFIRHFPKIAKNDY
jgi:hypothetical protein